MKSQLLNMSVIYQFSKTFVGTFLRVAALRKPTALENCEADKKEYRYRTSPAVRHLDDTE